MAFVLRAQVIDKFTGRIAEKVVMVLLTIMMKLATLRVSAAKRKVFLYRKRPGPNTCLTIRYGCSLVDIEWRCPSGGWTLIR